MIANLPNAVVPIVKQAVVNNQWFNFFRDLSLNLGYSQKTPIYSREEYRLLKILTSGSKANDKISFTLPTNWKQGTELVFYTIWAPADGGAGDIVLHYRLGYPDSDGVFAFQAEVTTVIESPEVALKQAALDVVSLDTSELERGQCVTIELGRTGFDPLDTYGDSIYFFCTGIKYQIEGVGDVLQHP